MLTKSESKDIQSLRHKKFRDESRLFTAEGPKIVSELLKIVPKQFKKVYGLEGWVKQHQYLLTQVACEVISETELEKITQLQTPNEVVAVLHQFDHKEQHTTQGFSLYLDAVQDPGNFGTIIRIADWFGIKNIICSEGCADVYNTKVVQATMASIARVNIIYDEGMKWLHQDDQPKYAAVLGGNSVYDLQPPKNGVLIIGNESKGINPAILEMAMHKITIPKKGEAESLNAAVATGILLSHLIK